MTSPKDPYEPVWVGFIEKLEKRDFQEAKKFLDFGWVTTRGVPLIDMRCDRFHKMGDGETALDHFAEDQHHDVFSWLLKHGADWKSMAQYGTAAPVRSDVSVTLAIKGSTRNMQELIDVVGLEPLESTASNVNMSLMHYACMHKRTAFVLALLYRKPDFLEVVDELQRRPDDLVTDDPESAEVKSVLRSWRAQNAAREAIAEASAKLEP